MSGFPPPDHGSSITTSHGPFVWNERPQAVSLPNPLTSFVGRELEIGAVSELLQRPDVRLLTLTGTGGIGKTRLALRVAEHIGKAFGGDVAYVALAPLRDPDLVLPTIAHVLDVPETADQPLIARLRAYLAHQHLLLVLDNVEHLIVATPYVTSLLETSPRLTLLCTSRIRLGVSGEHVYTLPPLTVPPAGRALPFEELKRVEAVQLFVHRAGAQSSTFALTVENASAVAELCRRLDGLPLAVELASARIAVLPPDAVLARLVRRLDLLTGGPSDAPTRLRDMRQAITWSHDLLDEPGQTLFRRLGVFVGGFTLDAAQGVVGAEADVLEGITALVAASLVNPAGTVAGETRFTMLETIREYAFEQLVSSGEDAAIRDAHASWWVDLAETVLPYWGSTEQMRWADRFEVEHDNVRAALAWLAESPRTPDGVRLVGAIWFFWFVHTHWAEGQAWLERAMVWSAGEDTLQRLRVVNGSAALALMTGDLARAQTLHEESQRIGGNIEDLGHIWIPDSPLVGLAIAAAMEGDYDLANDYNEQALALCRKLGDTVPTAVTVESVVLSNMAGIALSLNDEPRATRLAEESLAIQEAIGFSWGAADSLWMLAVIAERNGDAGRATALYRRSLAMAAENRDLLQIAQVLDRLALVATEWQCYERAVRLMGAAEHIHERRGNQLDPDEQDRRARAIVAARARLGEDTFALAWSTGRRLSLDDAIAEAMQSDVLDGASPASAERKGLSRREQQVLGFLVEGRSNRAIAETLSLSERTVENHVLHILTKLNVESRTAAATLAVRHGLV